MENVKENKMGVMPMNKLLINMSLPMMASMLVQALYNIVDSIYVSRIHQDALTALNLCFPIQMLVMSFGMGMATGVQLKSGPLPWVQALPRIKTRFLSLA